MIKRISKILINFLYRLIDVFDYVDEDQSFSTDDFKYGYIVKFRNGYYGQIVEFHDEDIFTDQFVDIFLRTTGIHVTRLAIECWDDDFNYWVDENNVDKHEYDIMTVYGYPRFKKYTYSNRKYIDIQDRVVLWTREDAE